jgi:hypothetical protein
MAQWTREAKDWLLLVCIDATVPITIAWERYAGGASTTIAIVSGLASLAALNTVLIATISARNKRQGQGVSSSLFIGGIGRMMFAALLTSLSAYAVPARNDYLELALSDKPLSDIHLGQRGPGGWRGAMRTSVSQTRAVLENRGNKEIGNHR